MPIGNIPSNRRLGISNISTPNASSFASNVLHLPQNIPIYQGALVHSTEFRAGIELADTGICGVEPDNEISNNTTIRQISSHDNVWSRRNLTQPPGPYNFSSHKGAYYNQIYYVVNEPEFEGFLRNQPGCYVDPIGRDCLDPRDNVIDPSFSSIFPDPDNQFWENPPIAPSFKTPICGGNGPERRIRPEAMAFIYLRLRRENVYYHSHVVLPPSAAETSLGLYNPDPNKTSWQYWETFYDKVRYGVTIGNNTEAGITPINLKAIHIHRYTDDPSHSGDSPSRAVAKDATYIRQGITWFRNRYNSNPLPADVLLSEMGLNWQIQTDLRWAGGWPGFATGLTWWNTWLCWLTRIGPAECNLQGWDTGAHTIHACIHEASSAPYVLQSSPNSTRTQWHFNTDIWGLYGYYNAQVYRVDALAIETPHHTYQNSFTAFDSISWSDRTWRTTPFGACYAVWAWIGADPNVVNYQYFGQGWVESWSSGESGKATISLPQGYSTVYFSIIKDMGAFPSTGIAMKWYRDPGDGALCWIGSMLTRDFEDSSVININGYNQNVYTSMVYPVVCYSSTPRTIKVSLYRWAGGPRLWFGRPIVLPGACSWIAQQ